MRSLCSEGDLGGRRPGEPREGGLVEGLGEGSGPDVHRSMTQTNIDQGIANLILTRSKLKTETARQYMNF